MHRKLNKGSLNQKEGRWKNSSDNMRGFAPAGSPNPLSYFTPYYNTWNASAEVFNVFKKKRFFAYYIHKKILSLQQNRFEMQKLNNRNGNINNDEKVFIDDCCGLDDCYQHSGTEN